MLYGLGNPNTKENSKMIKCNLSRILGERKMTRVALAKKAGLTYQSLKPLYDETWKGIMRGTIDALCKALNVQVGDLFEYVEMEEKKGKETKPKKGGK
ncbi:MAG: helix-turn-helix domain-containing protein [Ignavibacteriales bacterium]